MRAVRQLTLVGLLTFAPPSLAADASGAAKGDHAPSSDPGIALKLTPTYYHSSAETNAWDINLRGSLGAHNAWVGYYRRQTEFHQLRLGYDYTWDAPFGKLIPSVQYATQGFFGGSLNAEVGERYYALLGFGRTNLKPYYNLNFDPNDAITFGFGTRAFPRTTLSLYQILDDRLHTGQRITHLVARYKPTDKTRWTLDVFHKRGRTNADSSNDVLRGTGASATYDFEPYFLRVAYDPYVNFSNNHMTRLAAGMRF
jgi:hypothetical protein